MLLASCVRENLRELNPVVGAEEDGEYVTLDLSIQMMVEADQGVWTKALGEAPEVKDLYVAVFDKGDILTEIAKAEPGTVDDPRDVFAPLGADQQYLTRFHVTLKRTSESREVQFIAIGKKDFIDIDDFDMIDEASFIKKFIVSDNVDAYWCRKHFDGISSASSEKMQGLKMVRNFLKVSVSLADNINNFTLTGFKVFNKPRYGTLAPYNPNTAEYNFDNDGNASVNFARFADYSKVEGNEEDTANLAYKELVETQKYVGYMPSTVEYVSMHDEVGSSVPSACETWFNANKISAGNFDYLYECTYTDVANPYIIFKGSYSGHAETYYKADFVYQPSEDADKVYFHLLRNFFYELKISGVHSDGAATLEEAANSPSMNNFDGSAEAQSYTVISKTGARLYISSTDILVTDGTSVDVYLKNLTGDDFATNSPGDIKISKITPCINVKDLNRAKRLTPFITYNPGDNAYWTKVSANNFDPEEAAYISNYSITRAPGTVSYNGSDGWVKYTINLAKNPQNFGDNEMWQQEITFSNGDDGGLTRTLVLSGLKPYDFSVDVQDYVAPNEGEGVTVDITIPSGISKARFPLKFFIEDYDHTLYPNATNASYPILPVTSGLSKIPGKSGRSYWFTRTITYEEYTAAHEDIQSNKTFTSYFKTLVASSATSVYVQCDPESSNYFSGVESDEFVNVRRAGEIHFEKEPLYVAVGSKATNPVTVNSGAPVTYSVQNVAVATVNATTGEVIGVGVGQTIVTATIPQYKAFEGTSTTFTVKVAELLPEWHFEWNRLITPVVNVGKTVTTNIATATVSPGVTNTPAVSYTSSDPTVATVDASTGVVTGVSPGKVTITAHSEVGEYVENEGTENEHTYSAIDEYIRYEIEVVAVGVSPAIGTEYVNVPFYDGKMMWFTKSHEATVYGSTGFDAWNFRSDDVRYGMQASAWDYDANKSRNSHSWLISPELDLRAAVNPVLEFNHTGNYWTDGYTVEDSRDSLRTGGAVPDSITIYTTKYIAWSGETKSTTQKVLNSKHRDVESVTIHMTEYVPSLNQNDANLEYARTRMMQDALVHIRFNGGEWSEGTLLSAEEYPTGYNWISVNVARPLKTLLEGKTEEELKKVQFAFEYKASPEYFPADLTEYRPWGGTWQIKSFKVVEGLNNNP